ncbi:MAG: hypothetical protein C0622_04440 [Desulfuromonas sp.]|nr:MAG: hypothetical protein C0622_04440 [Desulfuromonas sp.]
MKRFLILISLLLVLAVAAGPASAFVVTATPSTVNVNDNVSIFVSTQALAVQSACVISVDYGDASGGVVNCAAGVTCNGYLNHNYIATGNYTVTATAGAPCVLGLDMLPPSDTTNVTVTCPPLTVTTSALPDGITGRPYSAQLLASGSGIGAWKLDEGELPDGLTLTTSGQIIGTPKAVGVFDFAVSVQKSCGPDVVTAGAVLSIRVDTPATADLHISRIQLSFDNGRPETTISRNQPGLRVHADLRFDGTGLLKGYWEVDGQMLAPVNQHLTYGKSLRLTTPAAPLLPTFVEGSHRVRLVITMPENEIPFPEAIYYVTSEESAADLTPLRPVGPANYAELVYAEQDFNWEGSGAAVYLVEFYARGSEEPLAAAYTRSPTYGLPDAILKEKFQPGETYSWRVKSFDSEGTLIGISEPLFFVFQ